MDTEITDWLAGEGLIWEDMDKDISTEYKRNKKLEDLGIN